MDRYFQEDGSAGLLDWQILSWSAAPAEMSYLFANLPIEFTVSCNSIDESCYTKDDADDKRGSMNSFF